MTYFRLLIVIFSLFTYSNLFSQNNHVIDSLEHWLSINKKQDTVWINNLILLEKEYYISKPEKLAMFADTIINVSIKLDYGFGIINGYSFKTFELINKSLYNEAIKTVFEKLKYVEKYKNLEEKANSFMQLGYLFALSNNNEKSLEYYLITRKVLDDIPNSNPSKERLTFAITVNTGMAYAKLNKHDKAIEGYLLADSLLKKSNQPKNHTFYYHQVAIWLNLGDTYRDIKQTEQSTYYLEKAIDLAKNKDIKVAFSKAYIALFANYLDVNRMNDAKAIKVEIETHRIQNQLSANDLALYFRYLNQYYIKLNDYKAAHESLLKYYACNDSVIGLEQKKQMQELTVKYETEKKDKDIALQKEALVSKEKQQKTYLIYFLSASLIALIVFLQLLYRHVLVNRKALSALKIAEVQTQKAKEAETFSHTISHDLRHPILQVRNTLDLLLKQSNFDDETTKHLQKAHTTLQQADSMVKQLLALFMLEEDEPLLSEVDTNELIQEVIEEVKIVGNKDTQFELASLPIIKTDRYLLKQIFINLLSNAVKYSSKEANPLIKVTAESKGTFKSFVIQDNGIGVSSKFKEKLFLPFMRNDSKGDFESVGLGLVIVKRITGKLHGFVSVKPQEKGFCIEVSLPT